MVDSPHYLFVASQVVRVKVGVGSVMRREREHRQGSMDGASFILGRFSVDNRGRPRRKVFWTLPLLSVVQYWNLIHR